MKRRRLRLERVILLLMAAFILFLYVNNTNLWMSSKDGSPLLLAHRGMAQMFSMDGIKDDTCTAERIDPPEHDDLVNTLSSIEAAFQLGADVVEFDVHPTKDDQFAVFHDWTLDCRTDAQGTTREFTMAELKQVDIGYGYTADQGLIHYLRLRTASGQ